MDRKHLDRLSQPVADIYANLELELLANISSKLKGKTDFLEEDPAAWQLQMMQNLGILDKENTKIIKETAEMTRSEMNNILLNAGLEGLQLPEEEMRKAQAQGAPLKVPPPVTESPTIIKILMAYEKQANDKLNLTNQSMLGQSKKAYIDILNSAVIDAASGYMTGQQAVDKTIRKWAATGIPALVTKDGRKLGAEGYVRMVMATTTNNMVDEMQDTRFEEYGIDLIEVSAHAGARPLCAPYQGRIFSLKQGHKKYPYIGDTSKGQPAGLFGINCGHYKYAYIEGISEKRYEATQDMEKNDRVYKESQQQRTIENSIRNAKTQKRMFEEAGSNKGIKEASQLITQRQVKMRKFIKETGRTRRSKREQLVKGIEFPKVPKIKKPFKAPVKPKRKPKRKIPDNKPEIIAGPEQESKKNNKTSDYKDVNVDSYEFIHDGDDPVSDKGVMIYDGLSDDETYALNKYVGTGNSWELNKMLYTGEYDKMKAANEHNDMMENIDDFSSLIKKHKIPYKMKTLRMVDDNYLDSITKDLEMENKVKFDPLLGNAKLVDELNQKVTGMTFENKSFTSVSYKQSRNVFKSKSVEMHLLIDEGTEGLITKNREESEIVLDKGTKIQFIEVMQKEDEESGTMNVKIIAKVLK